MASFKANGKEYELPSDLTVGEMCEAEEAFGVEFGNTSRSSMRLGAALVWIAIKRDDPSVKPEDVRGLPADLFTTMAADADPPPVRLADESNISGEPSEPVSDIQDGLSSVGSHGLDTGSGSGRETFFSLLSAS